MLKAARTSSSRSPRSSRQKGARITSHVALPGRFLVYMPTVHHTGVSRKLSPRKSLAASRLVSEAGGAYPGFIVRTAAAEHR